MCPTIITTKKYSTNPRNSLGSIHILAIYAISSYFNHLQLSGKCVMTKKKKKLTKLKMDNC